MTIKNLKEMLEHCDEDAEVLAEEKISGRTFSFDNIMGVCNTSDYKNRKSVYFYMI